MIGREIAGYSGLVLMDFIACDARRGCDQDYTVYIGSANILQKELAVPLTGDAD